MRKLSVRWVPRLLTVDQKRVRMNISNALLGQFRRRLITVDKTWYVIIRPKQKYSPNNELQRGNRLQKSKNCFFGWESDGDCFWDVHGVILFNSFQKGRTMTWAYYASLLDQLKVELAEKRPHLQKKKILFHQDRLAPQLLPWRKSTNSGLNCLTIHLTHQI